LPRHVQLDSEAKIVRTVPAPQLTALRTATLYTYPSASKASGSILGGAVLPVAGLQLELLASFIAPEGCSLEILLQEKAEFGFRVRRYTSFQKQICFFIIIIC
jgi:hypothetical protein